MVMEALTNIRGKEETIVKKFDVVGSVIYTGIAVLGVGTFIILAWVILRNLIFGV